MVGEQMPSEAEAGKVLWEAGEKAQPQVAKEKGRDPGFLQGEKGCHGFKETEIYHSHLKESSTQSILVTAFLHQQTTTAF